MERHAFRAMGTDVELLLDLPPGRAADGGSRKPSASSAGSRRVLSRFRAELGALRAQPDGLGRRPGPTSFGSPSWHSRRATRTGGRFDPTVHDALVAAGYDRSFEQVSAGRRASNGNGPTAAAARSRSTASRARSSSAAGVRLDLGGIGKGYAVDRAAERLSRLGPCLVDAGGDIAVRGRRWPVGVETANGLITLELISGALATSGRDRRRWQRERRRATPPDRSGHGPAVARAIFCASRSSATSAAEAEVLAKSLFLAGETNATREAERMA